MQVLKLDLDHENFFCPVTGQLIRNDETYQPSEATAFVFLDELNDFDFVSDELQPVWDLTTSIQFCTAYGSLRYLRP